jgi:hypothetical protein
VEVEDAVDNRIEAEFALEQSVKCPCCSKTVQNLQVVRLLRTRVNFTSNLPRRGFAIICPACDGVLSAHIGTRVI